MKLADLLPSLNLLQDAENVEGGLRQARSLGRTGGWIGVLVSFAAILLEVLKKSHFEEVRISWAIYLMGGVGLAALVVCLRYTFLIRESRSPFRYTCYVASFTSIRSEDEKNPCTPLEQKMNWLAPDLTRRLNERLQRILYLDADAIKEAKPDLTSHIHVNGNYFIRAIEPETQGSSATGPSDPTDARAPSPAASASDPGATAANKQDKLASQPAASDHAAGVVGDKGKSGSDQASGAARRKELVIQARIRIGPPGRPEVLARRICYRFPSPLSSDASGKELDLRDYEQIVERVYYNVATTIYEQIREDVQRKILLLPTRYLRAVSLYHEAEDYAKSGTLQSYEAAGALYRQAAALLAPYDPFVAGHARSTLLQICYRAWGSLRKSMNRTLGWFDPLLVGSAFVLFLLIICWRQFLTVWSGKPVSWESGLLKVMVPLGRHQVPLLYVLAAALAGVAALEILRRGLRKRDLLLARVETGCANMLLFRCLLSRLLAQRVVPIYEAKSFAERSRQITERLSSTRVISTSESGDLDAQLFNANATLALTVSLLGDMGNGRQYLRQAKASDHTRTTEDIVYLLAKAESSGPQEGLDILNRAAETYPRSDIVTFSRALSKEMAWRTSANPLGQVCDTETVIKTYRDVLSSNPGNIGSLANLGYVHWLTGESDEAGQSFQVALDYEEFMSDTVMSKIHYGLARLHAENLAVPSGGTTNPAEVAQTKLDEAYRHLKLAEEEATAYQSTHYGSFTSYYFEFINKDIFRRFGKMRRNFCKNDRVCRNLPDGVSRDASHKASFSYQPEVCNAVRSFVFNDYGEASWNMFQRTGDQRYRRLALAAFDHSYEANPRNLACLINLAQFPERADRKPLDRAQELEPNRLDILLKIERAHSSEVEQQFKDIKGKIEELETPPPSPGPGPSISRAPVTKDRVEGRPEVETSTTEHSQPNGTTPVGAYRELPTEKKKKVDELREAVRHLVRFTDADRAGPTIVEQLLPHKWLWTGNRFSWGALTNPIYQNEGRWERELNALQVQALYVWAAPRLEVRELLIPTIKVAVHPPTSASKDDKRVPVEFIPALERKGLEDSLSGKAGQANFHKLLQLIENIFSPADLELMLREYELYRSPKLANRMAGIVRYDLEADPANYARLTWLFSGFMEAGGCRTRVLLNLLRRAWEAGPSPWVRAWLALAYVRRGNELWTTGVPEQLGPFEPVSPEDCYIRALDEADQLAKSRVYGPGCLEPFGEPKLWGTALLRLMAWSLQKNRLGTARNAARGIEHFSFESKDEFLKDEFLALVSQPDYRYFCRLCFEEAYQLRNFETSKARLTADVCMDLLRSALPLPGPPTPEAPSPPLNVLTPIRLEIDEALLTDAATKLLMDEKKGLIPQMRAGIQAQFGVVVPGSRIIGTPAGTPPSYRIFLNEVTFATGTIQPALSATPSDADLRSSFAPLLQNFERVLIRNLVLWIEVQEVQNLLEKHCYDVYSEHVAEFETFSHILPLTALLQSLVEERTPITEFARIYNFYRQFPNRSDIDNMAAVVRMLLFVRGRLWGNDGSRSCVVLGHGTEDVLAGKVILCGETEILPLSVEEHHQLLKAFRDYEPTAVVVVRNASLRKHIWRLVSEELPDLPVLAEDELVGPLTGNEPRIQVAEWEAAKVVP